jgi:ligand-binding SRPBCC domain-containing protein
MYTLRVSTTIASPPTRCFDPARSVDVHVQTAGSSGEKAVGGRTSGLLELGDEVTWEARHLGVRQRLTSRITAFQSPSYFQDRMIQGAFRFLEHDHRFEPADDGTTVMVDVVRFAAPFGPVGWLAERLLLAGHLRRFLKERGLALKVLAESSASAMTITRSSP